MRCVVVAEDRELALHGDPRRLHRHEDHRLLAVARRAGIRLAHEDQDLAARVTGAAGPPLAAVDQVMIPVAHDPGLDVGRVARGNRGFGHRKAGADSAVEQRFEPVLALLRGPVASQHLHVARVGRRTIERFRTQQRAPHDFAQRRIFEIRETGAVLGVRQEQIPQFCGARLALELLDDLGREPGVPAAAVPGQFVLKAALGGINEPLHERGNPLLQLADLIAVRKIHCKPPVRSLRTSRPPPGRRQCTSSRPRAARRAACLR